MMLTLGLPKVHVVHQLDIGILTLYSLHILMSLFWSKLIHFTIAPYINDNVLASPLMGLIWKYIVIII